MEDTRAHVSDQAYDAFRRGYVEAMLWANTYDETGETVDALYWYQSPGRWWTDTPVDLDDADSFLESNYDTLLSASDDFAQHGHDFALTRNGHGAGFWDRGYGAVGDELTKAAHAYGGAEVFVTSDDETEG